MALMWLNWSVFTINAMLKLIYIYIYIFHPWGYSTTPCPNMGNSPHHIDA